MKTYATLMESKCQCLHHLKSHYNGNKKIMNTSGVKKESKNLKFTNTEKQQLKQHNDTVSPLKQIKYLQVKTNYLFQLIN